MPWASPQGHAEVESALAEMDVRAAAMDSEIHSSFRAPAPGPEERGADPEEREREARRRVFVPPPL